MNRLLLIPGSWALVILAWITIGGAAEWKDFRLQWPLQSCATAGTDEVFQRVLHLENGSALMQSASERLRLGQAVHLYDPGHQFALVELQNVLGYLWWPHPVRLVQRNAATGSFQPITPAPEKIPPALLLGFHWQDAPPPGFAVVALGPEMTLLSPKLERP